MKKQEYIITQIEAQEALNLLYDKVNNIERAHGYQLDLDEMSEIKDIINKLGIFVSNI